MKSKVREYIEGGVLMCGTALMFMFFALWLAAPWIAVLIAIKFLFF